MKKKELEIMLSSLGTFLKHRLELEQYQTESSVASDLLWRVYMDGNIKDKVVGDFGCGNGIFGIGALLLGAKKVIFVDVDKGALQVAKQNLKIVEDKIGVKFEKSFLSKDIRMMKNKVDTVLTNPPFGVQKTHSDKPFLLKGMENGKVIYSFHKMETKRFVERFTEDMGWKAKLVKEYNFPLRKGDSRGYAFWKKKVHYVDVGVWKITKKV